MCLIFISYRTHPDYRLVLAANRDEFLDRPTEALGRWPDKPGVIAGRDLKEGGTWMGVTPTGRFSAITNYRNPAALRNGAVSRGHLVADFLAATASPQAYAETVARDGNGYNGFNLLVGDNDGLWYVSNMSGTGPTPVTPGIHGLSNHLLDTPWPKVAEGKAEFGRCLNEATVSPEALFAVLSDPRQAPDPSLPDTGVGLEWERRLSARFISAPGYGTRSSSVVMISNAGAVDFYERTFSGDGAPKAAETRHVHFRIR